MKILICGGRKFEDYDKLDIEVSSFILHNGVEFQDVTIISGMAKGADSLALKFAYKRKCKLLEFPADWNKYGNKAGPIRNQQMIDEGKPDIAFAFPDPDSRGTWDMVSRLKKHNITVFVYE